MRTLKGKRWWLWILGIAVIALVSTGIGMLVKSTGLSTYTSIEYRISLEYPSDWVVNSDYDEKYQGKDGFFQLSAISGEGLSIDDIAKRDAAHQRKPYGSNPQIIALKIQGQKEKAAEARLIIPSADQEEEWNHQAAMIMKYPEAVKIGDSVYNYFILWADKEHVEGMGQSVLFTGKL